jgi:hypothetical protein
VVTAPQLLAKLGLCFVLLLPDVFFAAEFDRDGWRLAQPGYHLEFPRDHGPHFDYQTEWWYLTGNLRSTDGREFGYELTFFRYGYRSPSRRSPVRSRFVMDDIKFAHFTITDIAQKKFYASQRASRGAYHDAGRDLVGDVENIRFNFCTGGTKGGFGLFNGFLIAIKQCDGSDFLASVPYVSLMIVIP